MVNSVLFGYRQATLMHWGAALILAGFLAGCGRNDVQVYQVAKEPAGAPNQAMPPGHPDTAAAGPRLRWQLPTGWEEVPAGEMRLASFRVKGSNGQQADISIVPLPGLAGGDMENVNRWRNQVGATPLTQEDFQKAGESVAIDKTDAKLYEQSGKVPASGEDGRILAAILHRQGETWFFKMNGSDELVAQQKPAFVNFLKSMSFGEGEAMAGLPASHPPIDAASSAAGAAAGAAPSAAAAGKPAWEVPGAWKEVAGGQFLIAKFVISGEGTAQAAVNVSMSGGAGGGLAGNINRWRNQLGLEQLPEDEAAKLATPIDNASSTVRLVDLSGKDARSGQPARLVGAIVPQGDQTWFYKLMGDQTVVAGQKDAFVRFVQTAKY